MTLGLGVQDTRDAWIFRSSLDSQNFRLSVLFLLISPKLSKMKHCLLACILPECQLQGCQMVLTSSEQLKRYKQKTMQKNSQNFTNLDYICKNSFTFKKTQKPFPKTLTKPLPELLPKFLFKPLPKPLPKS